MAQRGLLDPEKEDPFALFVASTNIRYCYYHETHKILGNTFGINCLLMDDELNILPHSVHVKDIVPLPEDYGTEDSPEVTELKYLKDSLKETLPAGRLCSIFSHNIMNGCLKPSSW
eukprot:jgi/Pico_ML_1/53617/g4138.t1